MLGVIAESMRFPGAIALASPWTRPYMSASPSTDPGRLILPALRAGPDGGFAPEAARIADALDLGIGGFIVFGGTVESVRRLTADLLRRAGRPLLIAADLERGAGQQVAGMKREPRGPTS